MNVSLPKLNVAVLPIANPRGFQEGVHHSDGEEARHGHDRRLIIPADLELASAVETPAAPRRPPAHGLPAVNRPAASQPERI